MWQSSVLFLFRSMTMAGLQNLTRSSVKQANVAVKLICHLFYIKEQQTRKKNRKKWKMPKVL